MEVDVVHDKDATTADEHSFERYSTDLKRSSVGRLGIKFKRNAPRILQRRHSTIFCAVSSEDTLGFVPDVNTLETNLTERSKVIP